MTKFVLALLFVAAILVGSLLRLLRSRRTELPPPDVLERVHQRNRALDAERERND